MAVVLAKSLTMIYLSALMIKTGATSSDSPIFGLVMMVIMAAGPASIGFNAVTSITHHF